MGAPFRMVEDNSNYLQAVENQLKATELPQPINASDWLDAEPPEPDQIIEDVFDVKDKAALIGASKLRKSFFLMQLLLSVASGKDFLGLKIPRPRRVFAIQFEIQAHHYHRRLKREAQAMGITIKDLGDRFQILNARGLGLTGKQGIEKIKQIVEAYSPELISFDPLYKVASGAENAAEDMKPILNAFDELAEKTGAAIIYVHHDAKGVSGDRDIRDRGAGSNVLGRDYDAAITLTAHAVEQDAAVVEFLLRNYRPKDPLVALWHENDETGSYCYDLAYGIAPTKKTSSNGKAQSTPELAAYLPTALEIVKNGPLPMGVFTDLFKQKTGATDIRVKAFKSLVTNGNEPSLDTFEKRKKGFYEKLIGTPEQIARLRNE
ncbi:MAG: hypothetical protein C0392_15395 [Syntrophus sp. (in: bacteria)]|nr:hypothetical protein [Syntrophus sp. (in: bacteria)]